MTGLRNVAWQLQGKRLELLKEIAPGVARVAWLWSPANPFEGAGIKLLPAIAEKHALTLQFVEVRTPADFSEAFAAMLRGGADAVMAFGNPVTFMGRRAIADFARRHRLPSVFEERLFVEAGGLMSYAPSLVDLFRRAAGYIDRILKGAKPADLPVELPTKIDLVINRATARVLDLAIPPARLLRADEIIE